MRKLWIIHHLRPGSRLWMSSDVLSLIGCWHGGSGGRRLPVIKYWLSQNGCDPAWASHTQQKINSIIVLFNCQLLLSTHINRFCVKNTENRLDHRLTMCFSWSWNNSLFCLMITFLSVTRPEAWCGHNVLWWWVNKSILSLLTVLSSMTHKCKFIIKEIEIFNWVFTAWVITSVIIWLSDHFWYSALVLLDICTGCCGLN